MSTQPKNCSELVRPSLERTMEAIRSMLNPEESDVELVDDGTLDTVLRLDEHEERYSQGERANYDDNGVFDVDLFISDHFDELRERAYESFFEYGLAFDYVGPYTFADQSQAYFRYQISYGGPSTEYRFYVSPDLSLYHCEYWYLDWFDGAKADVPLDFANMLYEQFNDTGTTQHLIDQSGE